MGLFKKKKMDAHHVLDVGSVVFSSKKGADMVTGINTEDNGESYVVTLDNTAIGSVEANTSYITTSTGWSGGEFMYNPSTTSIRYTGDDGESVTIPLDTIATVDTMDEKIEKKVQEYNGTKPIIDKLEVIVKKLDAIDKKYLKNAMHDELKDLMKEINDYREDDGSGSISRETKN